MKVPMKDIWSYYLVVLGIVPCAKSNFDTSAYKWILIVDILCQQDHVIFFATKRKTKELICRKRTSITESFKKTVRERLQL